MIQYRRQPESVEDMLNAAISMLQEAEEFLFSPVSEEYVKVANALSIFATEYDDGAAPRHFDEWAQAQTHPGIIAAIEAI